MVQDSIIFTEPNRKRALVTAIVVSNIVTMLNAGSVNLAMPVFMSSFGANLNQVQWVMLGYVLSLACAMPLVSALCERFTYRRVFLWSLVAIGVFSLCCALASNLWLLIVFRVCNGFFSGIVVSSTMALIYRYLPVAERAQQYANVLVTQSVAFAVGPSFAGFVMQITSWRAIFILPMIFVVLAWVLAHRSLPVEEPESDVDIHLFGVVMVSVATGILLIAFTFLERWGLKDGRLWGMVALSILMVIVFIRRERNNPHPALDFKLFTIPSFALTIVLSLLLSTVMGITASVLAVYVQALRGFPPMYSGAVQLMPALFMALANTGVKVLYDRVHRVILTVVGFLCAAIGNGLMVLVDMDLSLMILSAFLCVRYIGIGFIRMPITDFGMRAVPQPQVSQASALINWVNQLSQAISTNVLTVVFTWRANQLFLQSGGIGEALIGKPGFIEANLGAFHLVFGLMSGFMLLGAVLSLGMIPLGRRSREKARQVEV